jgi:hypothetical protein
MCCSVGHHFALVSDRAVLESHDAEIASSICKRFCG